MAILEVILKEAIFKNHPKIHCKISLKWQFLRLFLILEVNFSRYF